MCFRASRRVNLSYFPTLHSITRSAYARSRLELFVIKNDDGWELNVTGLLDSTLKRIDKLRLVRQYSIPSTIYMFKVSKKSNIFKVNNKNTGKMPVASIVKSEHILHLILAIIAKFNHINTGWASEIVVSDNLFSSVFP